MFSTKIKLEGKTMTHFKGQVWTDDDGGIYIRCSVSGASIGSDTKTVFMQHCEVFDGKLDAFLETYTVYDEKRRLKS